MLALFMKGNVNFDSKKIEMFADWKRYQIKHDMMGR